MSESLTINTNNLSDFKHTVELIATACSASVRIIFLSGELGAGKTEFATPAGTLLLPPALELQSGDWTSKWLP